jgi:hypothetical protein
VKLVALAFLGPIYCSNDFVQSTLCFDELYFCGMLYSLFPGFFSAFGGWLFE